MKQEKIEKAANEKFSDNSFAYNGFIAGAEWRINSVWHTTADMPKTAKKCLVEYIDPNSGEITTRIDWRSEYEWVNACHYDKIIRWAYLNDLLPQTKEKGGEQ